MRMRSTASPLLAACLLSCDAVLGFQPGHLLEGGVADGGTPDGTLLADGREEDAIVLAEAGAGTGSGDARTDGAGDAAPGWTPTALDSLVLWLDSDVGPTTQACGSSNQCVTRWADRTSYHNDGAPWLPQYAPLLVPKQYGGHAAVRFDGQTTQLTIADNASLQFLDGRYTIVAVVAEQSTTTDGTIYGKTGPNYPYAGPGLWVSYFNQGSGIWPVDGRIGTQVDYTQFILSQEYRLDDGILRLLEADCDGTTLTLRIGGEPPLTRTVDAGAGTLAAAKKDAYVGGLPGAPTDPQAFRGDMTEVLVANDTLSPADWELLSDYLTEKYGLSSAGADAGVPEAAPTD
jgi:hypothetical protein